MPRKAREKSKSGIYHVMIRGINREDIFQDDEDRQKFIEIIRKIKEKGLCELYGYCLMSNHIHLLIQEKEEELSQILKRIGTSYAYFYNWNYERIGHLFQDRYKSEKVEDDNYLLTVLRYIHQNPLKANMVDDVGQYRWSSYGAYLKMETGLVNTEVVLGILGTETNKAVDVYRKFMRDTDDKEHLEDKIRKKLTDDEVRKQFNILLNPRTISDLSCLNTAERNRLLRKLKKVEGVSIRQIARITGLGRNIVANS